MEWVFLDAAPLVWAEFRTPQRTLPRTFHLQVKPFKLSSSSSFISCCLSSLTWFPCPRGVSQNHFPEPGSGVASGPLHAIPCPPSTQVTSVIVLRFDLGPHLQGLFLTWAVLPCGPV